ncbi:DUF6134 family protein [Pelagibius sp. Alg239-R121]|uniref:DUF6134 family protein n=1 Tax=Pelagibius sp. Alg239-R121 TaxID=2993448 RepID=UPI0024A6E82B|nr:DUF6134 family protein [Pelagibius sp. Alg239-R121]
MKERIYGRSSIRFCAGSLVTLALVTTGLFGLLAGSAQASDTEKYLGGIQQPSGLGFSVQREGDVIGHHSIDFTRRGDDLIVDVTIGLELKFAFITLFRYEHRNREVWRDERLVSIDTQTDNDGTEHWIKGRASDKGFEVKSDSGNTLMPADILPSSYWHPETPKARNLLNTQTGALASIQVTAGSSDNYVPMPWGPQNARSFKVSGDIDLNLWYDSKGCLLKLNFSAPKDGSLIDYTPARHLSSTDDPNLAGHPLIGSCTGSSLTRAGRIQE